ncbi:TlpA family protein disulfide reductase [Oceanobacillus chungangensis]|uniref:Cytochrome C biogenesis protein n=1 Tax=Oceanobacillus chungangensis TaxID=1229152 RepID=A0A3D8PRZ3_9BACI|nr:TlpA disulfide reductase family protein [Oceanobacillus chungangensis]RDW17745.1 cytochrome C biogenesis protein [Oceanobacillus chungangensis]
MYKKMTGLMILLVLVGILIVNIIDQNKQNTTERISNEFDVSGDTSVQGGVIAPIESVGIEPGELAPDIELEAADGTQFKLSELRGKKVLLNFWATWCPPCKEEMPAMQQFYDAHKDEMEVIAVNFKEKDQKVRDFINDSVYTYTIPIDEDGVVSNEYGVYTVPTTYFIGTDGIIQQPRKVGPMTYEYMEEMLQTLN